ncbi:hypothetical protein Lalb_Chr00c36g0408961 [Lupinus albus]|uniref:Uncharacterized protein n=1 Tax=Lupinus albus TaxID=3870 RepID=A0A6A4NC47_LUPAL|nr:hypothetical protein Lalb_Chr00c36g0408961 [Lupinus albus]
MAVTMAACSLGLHFSADKNIASVLMLKASSVLMLLLLLLNHVTLIFLTRQGTYANKTRIWLLLIIIIC